MLWDQVTKLQNNIKDLNNKSDDMMSDYNKRVRSTEIMLSESLKAEEREWIENEGPLT